MTIFDFSKSPGMWFEMEGGGRIQLKALEWEDWRNIEKATTQRGQPDYPKLDGKYVRFETQTIDENAQIEMIWDISMVAWENFYDVNSNPIPCTREMKVALMTMKDDTFRNFYIEKMKIVKEIEIKAQEDSEKNSSALPSGNPV